MNWLEWFGFTSDPFIVTPLQSEEEFNTLFIKTDSIEQNLSYISKQIKTSPFSSLIIGSRGSGKSTALQYALSQNRKDGNLSVYVGLLPHGIKSSTQPVFLLTQQIIQSFIQELICEIFTHKKDIFDKYERIFLDWGRYIGLKYEVLEGFYRVPELRIDFGFLKDILLGITKLVKDNEIKILLAIDNLDKIESKIVLDFLSGGTAQPLFEGLINSGFSILISADPSTSEIIQHTPDLSYLRRQLLIEPLSPSEAESLISKRVERYSSKSSQSLYEKKAIYYICNIKKGITRDIINEVRNYYEKAYNRGEKFISYSFVLGGSKKFNERDIYYELIKDDTSRIGAEKLLQVIYDANEEYTPDFVKYLISIYDGKRLKIPTIIMNSLIKNNIIFSEKGLSKGYNLDVSVYKLFNDLNKYDWDIGDFLIWIFKKDTVKEVQIQTLGSRSKYLINDLRELFKKVNYNKNEIIVLIDKEKFSYNIKKWHNTIINTLTRLYENYNILTTIYIEDINIDNVQQLIYSILKDTLLVFVKFYLATTDKVLELRNPRDVVDSLPFIFGGISMYQSNNRYRFDTFLYIRNIINNYDLYKNNMVTFSFNDVQKMMYYIDEITIEFINQLAELIQDSIEYQDDEQDILDKNMIVTINQKFQELFINDEYIKNININKENQKKMYLINDMPLICQKTIINNKNRHLYKIIYIFNHKRKINLLEIMDITRDVLRIFDYLEINTPTDHYKNKYELIIFSFNGFTDTGKKVLRSTQLPYRISKKFYNYITLNIELTSNDIENMSYKVSNNVDNITNDKNEFENESINDNVKILFLAANPIDSTKLRLDEEIREIDQALQRIKYRDKIQLEQQWAVRVNELQQHLLRYNPTIVHFSGHGSKENEIFLEDNEGNSKPVSPQVLSKLFSVLKDDIKCVVLNACYTEAQAHAISKYIDCVIGMSNGIDDKEAIQFSLAFYQALGYGRTFKEAFDLGCLQINMETLSEANVPKLLCNNTKSGDIRIISS